MDEIPQSDEDYFKVIQEEEEDDYDENNNKFSNLYKYFCQNIITISLCNRFDFRDYHSNREKFKDFMETFLTDDQEYYQLEILKKNFDKQYSDLKT